jgi:hypothetical protein
MARRVVPESSCGVTGIGVLIYLFFQVRRVSRLGPARPDLAWLGLTWPGLA